MVVGGASEAELMVGSLITTDEARKRNHYNQVHRVQTQGFTVVDSGSGCVSGVHFFLL